MSFLKQSINTRSIQVSFEAYAFLMKHVYLYLFGLVTLCVLYAPTVEKLIHKYATSGTYAHGFIVYPIVAWMIWHKRALFKTAQPRYEPLGLVALFILSLMWYVAGLTFVGIIQQLCFILMMITMFITCFGFQQAKHFSFPLAYLLFAIPFGNFLTPSLQNLTAEFSVFALELTGIPVYYEGWQISTSGGEFEVAEACSGIRYLIATLALGVLYAYFTYQKQYKRLIFALVCVFVPLIANGIRAYLIIIIAHYSKMKYAVGVDHLIYGWIFFGAIIFALFSVGAYWRDEPPVLQDDDIYEPMRDQPHGIYAILVLAGISVAPIFHYIGNKNTPVQSGYHIQWPEGEHDWQLLDHIQDRWQPVFQGPDVADLKSYQKGNQIVDAYIALYYRQMPGHELLTENNRFYSRAKWSLIEKSLYAFENDALPTVVEFNIQHRGERRLVWYVYMIAGLPTTNPIWGKMLEGYMKLRQQDAPSGVLVLSAEYDYYPDSARNQLETFLSQMGQPLKKIFEYDE